MALDEELDLPRPFGPYTLLRRLAVGGMAEVYVAKTQGISGFEKLVAIKVIHPRYSEDDHFVQMLVEEAKITVLLNHVNIAQTFDLGCIDDTYYIVMELIEGADAYRVMRKASEMKRALPLDLAAFIAAEVCNGLDYAHRKKDPSGQPLGIVHRDISPQNVLISYAGEVKVVDFGIAKAALRSGQTEAGVIKGKYYYMSPEQAWGDPMDHRSDIFSAGVCLYELLTNRMLYNEENVPLLLDKVRKAEIARPEVRRKSVPKALSDIVMRALQREPADRYQSAGEMQQALMQFVYSVSPAFTASRLAEAMGTLFPNEVQRHSAIVKLPSVEEPLPADAKKEPDPPSDSRSQSLVFDLAEEEDDMTRNDVLPFRKKQAAELAAAKAAEQAKEAKEADAAAKAPRGVTKPAVSADPPRATFRPPRMKYQDVPEESTAPGRRDDAGTERIAPPTIGQGGAWVAPLPQEAVTTNPRRAVEEVTDDQHAQAEWDDPTKLKGERDDWEEDATLVDNEGLASAIDLIRGQMPGVGQVKSERGKVNLQPIPKQPARLGQSAQMPLAPAAQQAQRNGKPASVPPPPGAAAWSRAKAPAAPAKSSESASRLPALAPQPALAAAPPPAMPPPAMPPPAMPQPKSSQSASSHAAVAAPRSSQSSPQHAAAPPHAPAPPPYAQPQFSQPPRASQSGQSWPQVQSGPFPVMAPPSSVQIQAPQSSSGSRGIPDSSSGSQPIASSGAFVAPSAPAQVDPFAPPPPAASTGGFEPQPERGASGRAIGVAVAVAAAVVLLAVALALALGGGSAPPAIEIISSPTGASVSIDGRPLSGTTPITHTEGLEAGRTVRVEVTMRGYQPWAAELAPNEGTLRQFVVLAPLAASLRVETEPPGADISVAGTPRGPSPVEVSGLQVGQDVEVRATLTGRAPVIRQVRIGEGAQTERIPILGP